MWDDVFIENNSVWWIRECVFEMECYVLSRAVGGDFAWMVIRRYDVELCVKSGGKAWRALDVTNSKKIGNIN